MKLALLGIDAESLRLAAAAVTAGHDIAWQGDLAAADRVGSPWLAETDRADDWEDLFAPDAAEAIIIGRGAATDELRARQVQELARVGRPMLLTFPLFTSVLSFFEVDMARADGGALVQRFNPLLESPRLDEFASWLSDGHPRWGTVEQVVAVRSLAVRSRAEVLRRFARDVDLLDRLAGKLNRIGAHAAAGATEDYSALSVQLLGSAAPPVRWTVEPPVDGEGLRLTFVCREGRETIAFDADDRVEADQDAADDAAARAALARFIAAAERGPAATAAASTWPQALHAMELADSIEISLRRGRMIDVHDQQLTEQLAFKGTMAAAGCGVLLVLIPAMLLAGWVAGLLGLPVARYWPHALLAMLAIFLGFQLLPKLIYRDASDDDSPSLEGSSQGRDST